MEPRNLTHLLLLKYVLGLFLIPEIEYLLPQARAKMNTNIKS